MILEVSCNNDVRHTPALSLTDADILHLQLLEKRLQDGQAQGELGVLLDGFPRTRRQAQMLALIADTQLAVNLSLRPEVIAVA